MFKSLLLLFLLLLPLGHSQSENFSNAQIYNGQQPVTGTATALTNQPLRTICIKALHGNATAIYLGNSTVSTSNGMELQADQSWCANITNANLVYVVASGAGPSVSWIGTN